MQCYYSNFELAAGPWDDQISRILYNHLLPIRTDVLDFQIVVGAAENQSAIGQKSHISHAVVVPMPKETNFIVKLTALVRHSGLGHLFARQRKGKLLKTNR